MCKQITISSNKAVLIHNGLSRAKDKFKTTYLAALVSRNAKRSQLLISENEISDIRHDLTLVLRYLSEIERADKAITKPQAAQ